MERLVRVEILPTLPNDEFWAALLYLIKYREQAFLTGILAAEHLAKDGTLRFDTAEAVELANRLSAPQVQKLMNMAVPLMQTEEQMTELFERFRFDDEYQRVVVLLRQSSPLAYFLVFKTLRHVADNHELVGQCCRLLQKRGDDLSLNMASILAAYFGLTDIQVPMSLRIEPYELSYLDHSYERFRYALEGKKPKILNS